MMNNIKKTDNNNLYQKLKEILEIENFEILQLTNISEETSSSYSDLQQEMGMNLNQLSNNDNKILFNQKENLQRPINIINIKSEQKILFNTIQTEQLFSALKQQAENKGFIQSIWNKKLQLKVNSVIMNCNNAELLEVELIKENNKNRKIFVLKFTFYNEDDFDDIENMSLNEKKKFEDKCVIKFILNDCAKEHIEEINEKFDKLINHSKQISEMLDSINFNNQDIIEDEIGYLSEDNKKYIAGYVVENNIILFNNPLQQFEYEINNLNRNRVLETIVKKEKADGEKNIVSRFLKIGFFDKKQYIKMRNLLDND